MWKHDKLKKQVILEHLIERLIMALIETANAATALLKAQAATIANPPAPTVSVLTPADQAAVDELQATIDALTPKTTGS